MAIYDIFQMWAAFLRISEKTRSQCKLLRIWPVCDHTRVCFKCCPVTFLTLPYVFFTIMKYCLQCWHFYDIAIRSEYKLLFWSKYFWMFNNQCAMCMFISPWGGFTSHIHFTSWTVFYWVHKIYVSFCDIVLCSRWIKIIPNYGGKAQKKCDIVFFNVNLELWKKSWMLHNGQREIFFQFIYIERYYFPNSSFLAYFKPGVTDPTMFSFPLCFGCVCRTLFSVTRLIWETDQFKL